MSRQFQSWLCLYSAVLPSHSKSPVREATPLRVAWTGPSGYCRHTITITFTKPSARVYTLGLAWTGPSLYCRHIITITFKKPSAWVYTLRVAWTGPSGHCSHINTITFKKPRVRVYTLRVAWTGPQRYGCWIVMDWTMGQRGATKSSAALNPAAPPNPNQMRRSIVSCR